MKTAHRLMLGSGSRVLALIVNVIVGLFLMPFVVHSLGDRIYGYWVLVTNLLGYYGLMDLGVVSAVQYHIAKAIGEENIETGNKAISSAFFTFLVMGIIVLFITVLSSWIAGILIQDATEAILFSKVILISGAGFAIGFPFRVFLGVISANLRFDLVSLINVGSLFVRTGLIICVLKMGYGIIGLALVTSLIDVTNNILCYPIAKRIQNGFELNIGLVGVSVLKSIFSYGIFNFIFKIAQQLRFNIQAFIVSGFIGVSAVTHYSIASRLTLYFLNFMISSFGLLSPVFSRLQGRKDDKGSRETFILGTKLAVCTSTFVSGMLILYGREFIDMWMGDNYLDAYGPLVILVAGMVFEVAQFPSVSYLQGVAKNRFLALVNVMEGIVALVLAICLGRIYGLVGVAMGAAIAMSMLKLFIQPAYVCRNIGIALRHYYSRVLGHGLLGSGLAVLIPWMVIFRGLPCETYGRLATYILLQGLIALPVVYIANFSRAEKREIGNAVFTNYRVGRIIMALIDREK